MKSLQVLLVEDSVLTARELCNGFAKIPFDLVVSSVATQSEALELLQRVAPDIVVLDLHLKQGTGFPVLRELGRRTPKPAIVVLTNYVLPKYREYSLLSGADYFLDKALDIETVPHLLEAIARRLNEAR